MAALEEVAEAGGELPQALLRRPELREGWEWVLEAWRFLTLSRAFDGMSGMPHPIPLTEVLAYCELEGLDDEDRSVLCRILRIVDSEYMKLVAKRLPKAPAVSSPSSARVPRRGGRR